MNKKTKIITKECIITSGTAAGSADFTLTTDNDYQRIAKLALNEIQSGFASGDLNYKLTLYNTSKNKKIWELAPKQQFLNSFDGQNPVNLRYKDRWIDDIDGLDAKGDQYTLTITTPSTTTEDLKVYLHFMQEKDIAE